MWLHYLHTIFNCLRTDNFQIMYLCISAQIFSLIPSAVSSVNNPPLMRFLDVIQTLYRTKGILFVLLEYGQINSMQIGIQAPGTIQYIDYHSTFYVKQAAIILYFYVIYYITVFYSFFMYLHLIVFNASEYCL